MDVEDEMFLEDDQDFLDIIDYGFPRRIYNRSEYFQSMDDMSFFRRFRLTKHTVLNVLQQIEDILEFSNDLSNSVSPINQLLTALRFYACAGHQTSIGDFIGIHQTTASRIINKVSVAIASLSQRYIQMPEGNQIIRVQNDFFNIARFPRVLGCVDGTHIKIQCPGGEDGEVYRNRKSFFSINTQVVCDSRLKIIDLVARWPGSAHDATIFLNSRIRARIEGGQFPNCIFLGDSGYSLKPYFLTPIAQPNGRAEQLYNESHIRTRNTIERLFGVWKRRFPVLAYGFRCKTEKAMTMIVSTAVLHNIAVEMNEDIPPPPENINLQELDYLIQQGQIPNLPDINVRAINFNYRQEIINNYFANL